MAKAKVDKQRTRRSMVRNFVNKHGRAGLQDLLDGFQEGISGQVLGDRFGVSRERVRHWREAFTTSVTLVTVKVEVFEVLDTMKRQEESAEE